MDHIGIYLFVELLANYRRQAADTKSLNMSFGGEEGMLWASELDRLEFIDSFISWEVRKGGTT
jgi:hypothetical protein